jgi:hypothetical protein
VSEKADEAKPAGTEVVDDAIAAAVGTRKTAAWLAGALGGIPSLAVLGALVRDPGDAGFDGWLLALGIGFALLGALIGILAFADVMLPVAVSDQDLLDHSLDITRIPGHPFDSYQALLTRLRATRESLWKKVYEASDALVRSKVTDAVAARSAAAVKAVEQALAADPNNQVLKTALATAKRTSEQDRLLADGAAAEAAGLAEAETLLRKSVDASERVRSDAFRLRASDVVSKRYQSARGVAIAAAVFVAIGVFCLAMAPQAKAGESPSAPSLVSLSLSVIILFADKGKKDRSRFDAAHELGHLVMHGPSTPEEQLKEVERQAHQFAAAFLTPETSVQPTSPAPWINTNVASRYVFGCTKKVSSGSVPGGQPG